MRQGLISHHDGAQDRFFTQHDSQAIDIKILLGGDGVGQLPPGLTVAARDSDQVIIFTLTNFADDRCGQSSQASHVKGNRFRENRLSSGHIHPGSGPLLTRQSPQRIDERLAGKRVINLCHISGCEDIRGAGLQILIHQNAAIDLQTTLPGDLYAGTDTNSNGNQIAADNPPILCTDTTDAAFLIQYFSQLRVVVNLYAVFF